MLDSWPLVDARQHGKPRQATAPIALCPIHRRTLAGGTGSSTLAKGILTQINKIECGCSESSSGKVLSAGRRRRRNLRRNSLVILEGEQAQCSDWKRVAHKVRYCKPTGNMASDDPGSLAASPGKSPRARRSRVGRRARSIGNCEQVSLVVDVRVDIRQATSSIWKVSRCQGIQVSPVKTCLMGKETHALQRYQKWM